LASGGECTTDGPWTLLEAPQHDVTAELGMTALIGGDPIEGTTVLCGLSASSTLLEVRCRGAFVQPAVPVRLDCEAGEVASTAAGPATYPSTQQMGDRPERGAVATGEAVEVRSVADLVHRSSMRASDQCRRRAQRHQLQSELAE
jgi:hypothetical protein